MRAFPVNLTLEQGVTLSRKFTWKQGKPAAPVDLTGCTAVCRFRLDSPKKDLVLELNSSAGTILLGGTEGTIELFAGPSITEKFVWAKANYQLLITFPDGRVHRLMEGIAEVSHSV